MTKMVAWNGHTSYSKIQKQPTVFFFQGANSSVISIVNWKM